MRNNDLRRWSFYARERLSIAANFGWHPSYVKQAADSIMEEWKGQRDRFLEMSDDKPKPGSVFTGTRFIIVCVR